MQQAHNQIHQEQPPDLNRQNRHLEISLGTINRRRATIQPIIVISIKKPQAENTNLAGVQCTFRQVLLFHPQSLHRRQYHRIVFT